MSPRRDSIEQAAERLAAAKLAYDEAVQRETARASVD